ncbi:MAG: M48 family metalloprotease [Planctomycetes bacterium]|nr:M48 family metalloprotease [Planctomycetota bacterium]
MVPLPLLLGLLVAFADNELLPTVPGASRLATLLPVLLLLAVPTLLAIAAIRAVREEGATGRRGRVPPRAMLRLSMFAVPIAVHALFAFADYGDWIERLAWDSHLGRIVLGMLPVFIAEVPRLPFATLAGTMLDVRPEPGSGQIVDPSLWPRLHDLAGVVRMRLGGPLLVVMPMVLLGAAMDLLQLFPVLHALVFSTAAGLLVGTVGFLGLAVLALPFWFRFAFGVRPLPEPIGTKLRAVAARLGFPPHRLYVLPTGMSGLNAMLVGPFRFGRCLCLTDGILRELDEEALAGVVAHEVGHAQNGHVASIMGLVVLVPVALMAPLRLVDLAEVDPFVQAAVVVVAAIGGWLLVQRLMHRFEHEADVASVAALGPGPCSRALVVVSRLAESTPPRWHARLLSRHPDEAQRLQVMAHYSSDAEFRAAFDRRGRGLRGVFAGVLLAALGLAAWGGQADWRYERVLWALNAGDHRAALRFAAEVDPAAVPAHWRELWPLIVDDLEVAKAVSADVTTFEEAQAIVPLEAWPRGEEVLRVYGPAAARAWFAMAIAFTAEPTAMQRALHAFCEAAADNDPRQVERIAAVVRRLGVPPSLASVFADGG